MALDKSALKSALKTIFEAKKNTPESVAAAMAEAIDTYVKGAKVSTSVSGTVVTGYGSGGEIEGTGEGSLS